MKFGLDNAKWEKLISIFAEVSNLTEVKLFGSRAKGNYRPNSDIDFVLYGSELNVSTLNKLENKIEEELLIAQKVDLIIFSTIDNQELIEHINRVGISVYKKSGQ